MSTTYGAAGSAEGPELTHPRMSWSAIFAGVVLVVAIELLLGLLGSGIGLGFVAPNAGGTTDVNGLSASGFSLGAFGNGVGLWLLASTLIALVVGGYAAARLAAVAQRFDGVLHGLVIWGLTLLLATWLIGSAVGGLIGGVSSVIGGTVSAAASALGGAASAVGQGAKPNIERITGLDPNMLQQQAQSLLQPPPDPASMSRADAIKAIGAQLPDLAAGGDRMATAKQRIATIVAAQADISQADAEKRVDDAQARFEQDREAAMQAAKQAAQASAAAASHASFLGFAGLLIGAIAAGGGGALAAPRIAAPVGAAGHWRAADFADTPGPDAARLPIADTERLQPRLGLTDMNEDEIKGTARDAMGKVKDAAGGLTGDTGMQADGKVDQAAGKVQGQYGSAKEQLGGMADKASDYAGRAGGAMGDAAQAVRRKAGQAGETAYDAATHAGQYVGQTVQQQPLLSLIGIAAIAYAAAFFIHSPSSPLASEPPRRRFLR
ncbi:CsbD family protein [Rhodopila sp.]|uniref:CsbD family protein n=1 Tax=Rhodopila sp. TaxID=2480087 RepID=UPI003D140705